MWNPKRVPEPKPEDSVPSPPGANATTAQILLAKALWMQTKLRMKLQMRLQMMYKSSMK